ncbi:hypothetical protein O1611_g3225 [Lasiodiplodia mahajangana]|uniref:Uncharacterized protein n=1 Tax=Lasiodiplodia mahajangana TaxID=1108764 RepID=A0ACC2JSE1_9PEZI|nr:hypothetical protein O1611_g3225 [Lasiodiplodia mahajangana]
MGEALVIPIRRLFVNIPVGEPSHPNETTRLSKRTGYEALFDIKLNLWFIFDEDSLASRWSGWFLVRCDLGDTPKPQSRETNWYH